MTAKEELMKVQKAIQELKEKEKLLKKIIKAEEKAEELKQQYAKLNTVEELKEVVYESDNKYADDETVDENLTKDLKDHSYWESPRENYEQMMLDGTIIVTQKAIDNLKADKKRKAKALRENIGEKEFKEIVEEENKPIETLIKESEQRINEYAEQDENYKKKKQELDNMFATFGF